MTTLTLRIISVERVKEVMNYIKAYGLCKVTILQIIKGKDDIL